MGRLTAVSLSACALALAACGANVAPHAHAARAAQAPQAAAPAASPSCAAPVRAELLSITRRIYAQAARGGNEASATRRLRRSRALADAVAAHDPRAVRAALAPLLKHQIRRIEIRAGGRTLARFGRSAAYAPVHGAIVAAGRVVGRYVMSVSGQRSFEGLVADLTRGTGHFGPATGSPTTTSFAAVVYPGGRRTVSLTVPTVPAALCGASAQDTRLKTMAYVARNIMDGEAHSAATRRVVRHVALDPAFRQAVAARDPAAVRAAIVGFFRDNRFHIVRVRASDGTQLIADVGGPYVLSPATGTIRGPGGKAIGTFMLAVQDDTGLIKLVHRFTGATVVLHTSAGTVPGSGLVPGPPFTPGLSTVTYGGRTYRSYGLTGTAFPTGQLEVSLLVH